MKLFYKHLPIFGVVGVESNKTAGKSIYDIFNNYSMHYQVILRSNSLHLCHNDMKEIIKSL